MNPAQKPGSLFWREMAVATESRNKLELFGQGWTTLRVTKSNVGEVLEAI